MNLYNCSDIDDHRLKTLIDDINNNYEDSFKGLLIDKSDFRSSSYFCDLIHALRSSVRIECIGFRGCIFNDDQYKSLMWYYLETAKNLQCLILSDCGIHGDRFDLLFITIDKNTSIRELDITDNPLKPTQVERFEKKCRSKHIHLKI